MLMKQGRKITTTAIAVLATTLANSDVSAQNYPNRVVEVILPYPPGPSVHTIGLALTEGLSAHLGQRFILVNRPGANGAIGTAAAARAAPDGHTLMFTAAVSMVVNPLIQAQTGYTLGSFEHICQTFKNEMVLV